MYNISFEHLNSVVPSHTTVELHIQQYYSAALHWQRASADKDSKSTGTNRTGWKPTSHKGYMERYAENGEHS
jgi:hypothetical protein